MIDFNKEGERLNAILFQENIPGNLGGGEEQFKIYVEQLFIRCEINELDRAYRLTKSKIESICPDPFSLKSFTGEGQKNRTKRFNLDEAIDRLFKIEKEGREVQISKEGHSKGAKDKFTHKQQILLLHSIGFFGLDFFKDLNETQKGILVSHIVNRDEKNSEDNIRYVRGKRASEDTKRIFTKDNLKAVNELLEKVGLKQYKVS